NSPTENFGSASHTSRSVCVSKIGNSRTFRLSIWNNSGRKRSYRLSHKKAQEAQKENVNRSSSFFLSLSCLFVASTYRLKLLSSSPCLGSNVGTGTLPSSELSVEKMPDTRILNSSAFVAL